MFNLKISSKTSLWLAFALLLFVLPLLSQAGTFTSTGPSCGQDFIPDDSNLSAPVKCPICRNDGTTKLQLKWDINDRSFADPFCSVSCTNRDGKSCGSWNSKDKEEILTSSVTDTKLKPKDVAYLSSDQLPYVGDYTYKIQCMSQKGCPSGGCLPTQELSPPVVVSPSCGEPCEVSWPSIVDSFKDKKPVHITESNLRNWVIEIQDSDNSKASNNNGSGDLRDIEDVIIKKQCENESCILGAGVCPRPVYFNSNLELLDSSPEMKKLIDKNIQSINTLGDPQSLTIRSLNWPIQKTITGELVVIAHDVIVVGIKSSGLGAYNFEIIDPNIPSQISSLNNCRYAKLVITSSGTELEYTGLKCGPLSAEVYGDKAGPVFILRAFDNNIYTELASTYHNFCQDSKNILAYKNLCTRGKINDWLKNNLTSFANLSDGGGACFGWTDFFLKNAYLGDFIGTDYHPDDKNYVGVNCDINRYPLTKKTSFLDNSALWLANLFEPLKNLKLK